MTDIKVIINGIVADLPPQGLNLPLTYSLKSRDGININTGSRSEYAFELPATKQNDIIFSSFYISGIINIDKQIFLDASIEVDGLPFFIGKCQLQSVTLKDDLYTWGGKAYKVAFYGNNSDWVVKIGDLRIADLPFSTHTYSYLDNLAAWGNEYPAYDYKYIPLKLKDYSTFGQLDSLEDSHPALFIVDILNKTFNSIGYTIQSNFFATQFAERLIMPVPILAAFFTMVRNLTHGNTSPPMPTRFWMKNTGKPSSTTIAIAIIRMSGESKTMLTKLVMMSNILFQAGFSILKNSSRQRDRWGRILPIQD